MVTSQCCSHLHVSDGQRRGRFHVPVSHGYVFFWEVSIISLAHFLVRPFILRILIFWAHSTPFPSVWDVFFKIFSPAISYLLPFYLLVDCACFHIRSLIHTNFSLGHGERDRHLDTQFLLHCWLESVFPSGYKCVPCSKDQMDECVHSFFWVFFFFFYSIDPICFGTNIILF